MIEVALFATIAYILDLVTQPMSLGPWISLSFKMVPIFLLSFRWGLKAGAMGGLIWGLLQVILVGDDGGRTHNVLKHGGPPGQLHFAAHLLHAHSASVEIGDHASLVPCSMA